MSELARRGPRFSFIEREIAFVEIRSIPVGQQPRQIRLVEIGGARDRGTPSGWQVSREAAQQAVQIGCGKYVDPIDKQQARLPSFTQDVAHLPVQSPLSLPT